MPLVGLVVSKLAKIPGLVTAGDLLAGVSSSKPPEGVGRP
jgi:hypothetical protein